MLTKGYNLPQHIVVSDLFPAQPLMEVYISDLHNYVDKVRYFPLLYIYLDFFIKFVIMYAYYSTI